jgi:hypothetical protein
VAVQAVVDGVQHQSETKGTIQQRASHVQYDWVSHLDPKV